MIFGISCVDGHSVTGDFFYLCVGDQWNVVNVVKWKNKSFEFIMPDYEDQK
jgi:hypothetical protein